ncbi:hypothetical protein G6F59_014405 [Rhizopus arrhizus]|nr:hypothetical protein G6F59_014405 [Rhizopus arrhizus]
MRLRFQRHPVDPALDWRGALGVQPLIVVLSVHVFVYVLDGPVARPCATATPYLIVTSCFSTPSRPPNTVSVSIFSVTFSSASSSFKRISTGLSSISFAVLSCERVALASSRRRNTLAWACFSASTTPLRISFISPGRITSLMPTPSNRTPWPSIAACTCAAISPSSAALSPSSSSRLRAAIAWRRPNCSCR